MQKAIITITEDGGGEFSVSLQYLPDIKLMDPNKVVDLLHVIGLDVAEFAIAKAKTGFGKVAK